MIYKIKKCNEGGFEIVNSDLRPVIIATVAIIFAATVLFKPVLLIFLVPAVVCCRMFLHRLAENTLLDFYKSCKITIVCFQKQEGDSLVFNRAQNHRDLLRKSENHLYLHGYIGVLEIYQGDIDVCETRTEYLLRVEHTKSRAAQVLLNIVRHDELFLKKWIFGQIL